MERKFKRMTPTGFATYQTVTSRTEVSQEEILLKLYDGLLRFLSFARRGIEIGSPSIRGENISKALKIINELECALDMEAGGKISLNLSSLYGYMIERLTQANINDDVEIIKEVEGLIIQIKEGFEFTRHSDLRQPKVPVVNTENIQEEGLQIAI
jgi:flagellar protein FliS